ncbi:MAG: hypothetical protein SVG88_11180 [Halobacteriales archaeon]|nr:hypothetical protein [Halobacteriales archaeon]
MGESTPLAAISDRPELWAFLLSNAAVFVFATMLTAVSYVVYRRQNHSASFRTAKAGFGIFTIGGLIEPVYELTIGATRGEQVLRKEVLIVQTVEAVLFAIGFGLLVYSIFHYRGPDTAYSERYTPESDSD